MPNWLWVLIGVLAILGILLLFGVRFHLSITTGG